MTRSNGTDKQILFLYTELAEYFLSCVRALVRKEGVQVTIVRWPVNKEAPFELEFPERVTVYDKEELSFGELFNVVQDLGPDLIYVSGWIDREYLKVAKAYAGKVPTVVGMDNQWEGTLKQRLAGLYGRLYLRRIFSHTLVPGDPQEKFAINLGFPRDKVVKGLYVADVDRFHQYFEDHQKEKENKMPRRFLYMGRYLEHKGIFDLWEAFEELKQEQGTDWELWCAGTGEMFDERVEGDGIEHLGFVQPSEMGEVIRQTSVFVLPSHFEPWGVVVHEFASAGYPLLLSEKVGAGTYFLNEGSNGFRFRHKDAADLKRAMESVIATDEDGIRNMGEESRRIASTLTPDIWSDRLLRIIEE